MRFGSVCSGIEAASVAWGPLGWEAAWFSEIEPFPCALLAHHFPTVPNHGDMTTLPERILFGEVEAPDMLCGGTPCQAFSVAGQRKSLDDDRGNLSLIFCEVANAIDSVRSFQGKPPAVIFWENVPGVLSTKDNAFGCFLAELVGADAPLSSGAKGDKWPSAGYVAGPKRQAAWRVLDAQYFGVPQRRRRVFVIASAREGFDPCEVLFESPSLSGDPKPCGETGQSITGEPQSSARGAGDDVTLGRGKPVTPTIVAGYDKCYNDLKDGGCLAVHKESQGLENNLFPKRTFGEYRQGLPAGTLKACGDDTGLGGENLVIDGGFREGSFGTFVEDKTAGTVKAVGGVLGGGSETLVVRREAETCR